MYFFFILFRCVQFKAMLILGTLETAWLVLGERVGNGHWVIEIRESGAEAARRGEAMGIVANGCSYLVLPSSRISFLGVSFLHRGRFGSSGGRSWRTTPSSVCCTISESGTVEEDRRRKRQVEDYNTAMKRMMRNPYEYHHDLGKIKLLCSLSLSRAKSIGYLWIRFSFRLHFSVKIGSWLNILPSGREYPH